MSHIIRIALISALLAAAGAWAGPVNVNTADAATLAKELRGIGPSKAQAIVDYRQKHGPFKSVDDLGLVKGISQKLLDQNRSELRLDKPSSAPAK